MEANERETAINKLVEDNVRLVYSQLTKWSLLDNQDAESDAFLALWKAASTFDASKGYAFSTYACTCISNAIRQLLRARKSTRQLYTVALETLQDDEDRSNDAAMEMLLSYHETPESSLLLEELRGVVSEKALLVYNRLSTDNQRRIVALWLESDGRIRQAELAERTGTAQPYVSRILATYKNNLKKELKGYL